MESLTRCALRGVLERRGAQRHDSQQQIEGIVVHALVDGLAKGCPRADLVAEMERFLSLQTQLPPWLLARTRRALEAMLTAAQSLARRSSGPDRSLAGIRGAAVGGGAARTTDSAAPARARSGWRAGPTDSTGRRTGR